MKTDPSQITLTDDQRLRIARAADNIGAPWAVILESALSSLPEANCNAPEPGPSAPQTILDRLKQSGFLAALAGGPPDLGTNPKHMEAFGKD